MASLLFKASWKRLLVVAAIVSVLVFAPIAIGVFPIFPAIMIAIPVLAFSLFAFSSTPGPTSRRRIATVLLSTSFAITLADLLARPVLFRLLEDRPTVMFAHTVPQLPMIYRFASNVNFRGTTFGDLAAVSGQKAWRQPRTISFQTDGFGFRNASVPNEKPLDLIVLGDSYGVGDGTSQDKIWPSLLATEQHLAVYNLSMDGASPWQEDVNFLLESRRLKTYERTTLLWVLFTGNDLIDPCYPAFKRESLPWLGPTGELLNEVRSFRYNSPLRRVLLLHGRRDSQRADIIARTLPDGATMLFDRAYADLATLSLDQVQHHTNFENIKETFAALKKLADERKLRVIVVVAPAKEEVYEWIFKQQSTWPATNGASGFALAMEGLSRDFGFQFFDLKAPLIDSARNSFARDGSLLWWRDDTHWNESGHKAVADIIGKLLAAANGPDGGREVRPTAR